MSRSTDSKEKVVQLLKSKKATREEIKTLTGLTGDGVYKILRKNKEECNIQSEGRGKKALYWICKEESIEPTTNLESTTKEV